MNHATTIAGDDALRIEVAAHRLEISEFELFEAAYRDWHPHEPTVRELEKHFVHYLFNGIAPVWVRDFVRRQLPAEVLAEIDAVAEVDLRSLLLAPAARIHELLRALLQVLQHWPAPSCRAHTAASVLQA